MVDVVETMSMSVVMASMLASSVLKRITLGNSILRISRGWKLG